MAGVRFRLRLSRNRCGKYFVNLSPAISPKSKESIYSEIRLWCLPKKSALTVKDVAQKINPVVHGWIEYYGAFFQS
jgi:RNA-directed DNA polymerase